MARTLHKTPLQKKNQSMLKRCLNLAEDVLNKSMKWWQNTAQWDEIKFGYNWEHHVWRRNAAGYLLKNTTQKWKISGGNITTNIPTTNGNSGGFLEIFLFLTVWKTDG